MKSKVLLMAGAGLLLSGCSILPDWFGGNDAEVSLGRSADLGATLAADTATGSISEQSDAIATETASLSSGVSQSFNAGFGRNDGGIQSTTASAKTPGTGGLSR